MAPSKYEELNFGSELERFILSHATLKPGDKLEGKVIQIKPNGKLLIHFGKFRAVADSPFSIKEGEIIHVIVVAKRPKLKLRLETPQLNVSPGARQVIRKLEMVPENQWSSIRAALEKFLDIKGESLFPPGVRDVLAENENQVKLKILSQSPLHLSLLLETLRWTRVRIDFYLVTIENNLNVTFFVKNHKIKQEIQSHLAEIEENLKGRFQGLVLDIIVSARKIAQFDSENLDAGITDKKMLDVKA